MRIGFITQWFPPEQGALIPESIATGLAERGHDVHVLTAFPNYPTGRLYPGWHQRPYVKQPYSQGVTIHRTPVYPSHDTNPAHRMANYLSHAASAAVFGTMRFPRPDVWLIYSSPATAAIPAQVALKGHRAPVCLLIQDLWPDSVTGSGMVSGGLGRVVHAGLDAYTRQSYRHAARIGVTSPGMVDLLVERGVPATKIRWTPNWLSDPAPRDIAGSASSPPVSSASVSPPSATGRSTRRTFLYAGNLGAMQGLDALVDAFALVPEAELELIGDGVHRDALADRTTHVPNVNVLPAVGPDEIGARLAAADVLVVSLKDTPLLRVTMPSKVQAALRAGRPILVHGAGDVAALVEDNGAGLACSPSDPNQAAQVIRRLVAASRDELTRMGDAGRHLYASTFCRSEGVTRLESLLLETQALGRTTVVRRDDAGRDIRDGTASHRVRVGARRSP
ncbi:glycosyltransferase [Nostocoides sp. F2B08]|uniref:glycosyltransferase family 4 protein n=1 Tax=Nostocoides sp. F2B08 TaxID=2653936 RepID=UPI001262BC08|nr:glycosyltransferase family 4 protein [Tetrasphaera sp. F2B08]KAB7743335.1 glycosyltransferase [Tetrasphaera sp. F2B08]